MANISYFYGTMKGYIEIEKYEELQSKFELLKFQMEQLQRMLFGVKSERYIPESSPEQLNLFGEPIKEEEQAKTAIDAHERKKSKAKNKPARLPLPEHLERKETVILPDVDLEGMVQIGTERTETLVYIPIELYVKVLVRPKFAPKAANKETTANQIHIADLPSRFIERCQADELLLAAISIDKFVDHLPLYRIIGRFERLGVTIPRSTMSGWIAQSANQLFPLYNKLVELVLQSNYLEVDETRIEVQTNSPPIRKGRKRKKGKTHRGFYWAYLAVKEKIIFFEYDKTRKADNPLKRLKDFKGTLQTDCYDVYDQIRKVYPDLTHYHCLNHARREFEKALSNDKKRVDYALKEFQLLYEIEEEAREEGWSAEKLQLNRQENAKPVLDRLFKWMEEESPKTLPKSPIGKAMGYMLKRKQRMMHYLTDGNLMIDTNLVENAIRPIAVGRKNYLFAGSHEAAQRAAIFYSLFACCKFNEVDPLEWMIDVMKRLPEHPINQIEQLLPHIWKQHKTTETVIDSDFSEK